MRSSIARGLRVKHQKRVTAETVRTITSIAGVVSSVGCTLHPTVVLYQQRHRCWTWWIQESVCLQQAQPLIPVLSFYSGIVMSQARDTCEIVSCSQVQAAYAAGTGMAPPSQLRIEQMLPTQNAFCFELGLQQASR